MSTIFFIEFVEDIESFLKHRDSSDIVIALKPEVSAELDILKIPHKCLRADYYTHEEYMASVNGFKRYMKAILFAMDEELWMYDPEYRNRGIRPFEMFIYFFKFPFTLLRSEIFELDKLFNKETVNKVKLIKNDALSICSALSFYDDESVYEKLIYLMQQKFKYDIDAIDNKHDVKNGLARARKSRFEVYTPKEIPFVKQVKELIKRLYRLKDHPLNKKGNIMSVDCCELLCIKQKLVSSGWSIHQFSDSIFDVNPVPSRGSKYNGLVSRFEKNKDLMRSFEFLGVNFFGIIKSRLENFCQNLETIFSRYQILSDYMNRNHFDIVFFTTHTPFKLQNVMLPLICRKIGIPYVCWMHGGHGANYKIAGFELSDYAFGQHYFVYGEEVKKSIDSYYSGYNLLTHVVGSPKILRRYQNYTPPKNARKVITFIGTVWSTNYFHPDVDSSYSRFSYWTSSKAILELLIQYRHTHRIIIRTRPGPSSLQIQTFRRFLKYHNVEEVEIMPSDEMSFEKIVEITDLFITQYVSTTFWEASFSHADIFLMDDSDLTEAAKEIVAKRAFWYADLPGFIQGLRQYLDKGAFYQKSHDKTFLKNYMDYDRKDRIVEHVSQTIEDIIKR